MIEPVKVLIVEDEISAAKNLKFLLQDLDFNIRIIATIESVSEAITWLQVNESKVDLAFFDIQLEDGLSFEILEQTEVAFPIIFTTAYDEYALKAFKANSIDYLLKPINEKELKFSLEKFFRHHKKETTTFDKQKVEELLKFIKPQKKLASFLIYYKDKLLPVPVGEFAYFNIKEGVIFGYTFKNASYPLDYKLDDLEDNLDENLFFRANRQFIIHRDAIIEVQFYFNGRLLILLKHKTHEQILVSKARATIFKNWLKGS